MTDCILDKITHPLNHPIQLRSSNDHHLGPMVYNYDAVASINRFEITPQAHPSKKQDTRNPTLLFLITAAVRAALAFVY